MVLIKNNLTNIEKIEKHLGECNYFDKDIYSNIKSALGKNPWSWLIPVGKGYEEGKLINGYEYYTNSEKILEYIEIMEKVKLKEKEGKGNGAADSPGSGKETPLLVTDKVKV